jgi:hypothetical protein
MRIKLDENLGQRGAQLFRQAGHEVATVAEQSLTSATDDRLSEVCAQEDRCLVTLDLDFSNPFLYPPAEHAGLAVLRPPHQHSAEDIWALCQLLALGMNQQEIHGKLWIVQRGRIREYRPDEDI